MKSTTLRVLFPLLILYIFSPSPVSAQVYPNLEQGLKPYGTYHGGDIDSINMVTGHLTVRVPFYSLPQRGGKLKFSLSILYDNVYGTILQQSCAPPPSHLCTYRVVWKGNSVGIAYDQSYFIVQQFWDSGQLNPSGTADATVPIFSVVTPDGASHQLAYTSGSSYESIDGTGFRFDATNNTYDCVNSDLASCSDSWTCAVRVLASMREGVCSSR